MLHPLSVVTPVHRHQFPSECYDVLWKEKNRNAPFVQKITKSAAGKEKTSNPRIVPEKDLTNVIE